MASRDVTKEHFLRMEFLYLRAFVGDLKRERMLAASSELRSQVLEEKIFSRAAHACESLETAV